VRHLREHHDLPWRDIREIRLGLPVFAVAHGATVTRPADAVSAQFSTAFSIALMLVRGKNRPEDYTNPRLWTDPDLLSVIDTIVPYPKMFEPDQPAPRCQLDVTLRDGRVLSHCQRGFRGHPSNPETSDRDFETKFLANVEGILSPDAARRMLKLTGEIDQLNHIAELMLLTSGG
jgi:2-methylcitrate dehydratase PrpD